MTNPNKTPDISVVVVVYNMAREAPRTLLSLSARYQRDIAADDFEIIVVDNGSSPPLDPAVIEKLEGNFRLIRIDNAPPSPAKAINIGLREARGKTIGVMIDGARIVTPGLLNFARNGARMYERAVVGSLGYYLGFDMQRWSIEAGYNAEKEDALLDAIEWPKDGYRLFEIATPDGSAVDGYLQPYFESNAIFLSRESWELIGGADERFDLPGGGLLNLDILRQAVGMPGCVLVTLLGEGTFHQVHGGIATNASLETFAQRAKEWVVQNRAIRGKNGNEPLPVVPRAYIGTLPKPALLDLVWSALEPLAGRPPPLGPTFNRPLWALGKAPPPKNKQIANLTAYAERLFASGRQRAAAVVARLIRARAPDEPAPQRILARTGSLMPGRDVPESERAAFHHAVGDAYRQLGDKEKAEAEFRAALKYNANFGPAHVGLSLLRFPGRAYTNWLSSFHEVLTPEVYLEVGVAKGATLQLARPPTIAIGIDPVPEPDVRLSTQSCIFAEPSDDFFASGKLDAVLAGRTLRLAFIDGLHVFEQALRDFMNVERYCDPNSVVLFHDTVPLDELTQRPVRECGFYTGDIWKTILCLKEYRPDLDIRTIATHPSGLTMVTGLDPKSTVLSENYDAAVKKFAELTYAESEKDMFALLNVVPNDWDEVLSYLQKRGIVSAPATVADAR